MQGADMVIVDRVPDVVSRSYMLGPCLRYSRHRAACLSLGNKFRSAPCHLPGSLYRLDERLWPLSLSERTQRQFLYARRGLSRHTRDQVYLPVY